MTAARPIIGAALAVMTIAGTAPAIADAVPWRDRIGLAGARAPAVSPASPFLALVDSPVDLGNAALAGAPITADASIAPFDLHGTATASVAGATGAAGILGVWPGMRLRNYPFADGAATCERAAALITRAVAQGAATISMSYGSESPCFAELAALQAATRRGVVLVAAAGNGRLDGNPLSYPAAYPHVIAVAALGDTDSATTFSSTSTVPDLAAPGKDVLTAVPVAFDPDPLPDGLALLTGTSFSAPMVAAAATWLRAVRPALTAGQIGTLLCDAARDVPPLGFDRRTGCGALDLHAALRHRAPAPDPGEPNDDVQWVDGVSFATPSHSVWRGGGPRVVRASVAAREDPSDVYRILRPPHSRTRITLTPGVGGADLRVLDDDAIDIGDRAALLSTSRRARGAIDRVTVVNRSARFRIAYVVVTHDPGAGAHRAAYALRIERAARRPLRGPPLNAVRARLRLGSGSGRGRRRVRAQVGGEHSGGSEDLDVVLGSETDETFDVGRAGRLRRQLRRVGRLPERGDEPDEVRRGDGREPARRARARHSVGVGDVARRDGTAPRPEHDRLGVTGPQRELARDDVEAFVLAVMHVKRGLVTGATEHLDDAEPAIGLLGPDVDRGEVVDELQVARHDPSSGR